jgi:hypothetical protein
MKKRMFIALDIYPNRLKMKDSASRKRVSTKTLIERNGCSIVKINNAGDDPLSPCPAGAKLENQCSVAALDKGITIICVLCLALIS